MDNKLMIEKLALALYKAEESKQTIAPIRTQIGVENIDLAYQIQEINTEKRRANGGKITGKKIGLTSFAVQKQLGVDQPDFGVLFEDMEVGSKSLKFNDLMQPKAEVEIAFTLKQALTKAVDMDDLLEAIDYAQIAIEIVGSRIANWDIKITDTIADNASASHYILGAQKVALSQLDLVHCKMQLFNHGKEVSSGLGKACMDNPLNAALWLANKMIEQGSPLGVGEVILSGALGPMVNITQGDSFRAIIDGLGEVNLNIG